MHAVSIGIGGDGSLRGARALYEGFGVQVVGLPGTIDNNIAGTTALGFHSAVALEDTLDLDVFSPPRQDWLDGTDHYLRGK